VIPRWRESFNAQFTDEKYQAFVATLEEMVGAPVVFRPCETPVFLPTDLLEEMEQASLDIISQLRSPEYLQASTRAIPREFNAPNEGDHPDFVVVDFAITHDDEGRPKPKLIELQGCASLYAFQLLLPRAFRQHYELDDLVALLNGLTEDTYTELFRGVVVGSHSPEQVILMEIEPEKQKTLPDFLATEKLIGVSTVSVSDVIKRGRKLYYSRDGRETEIRRIYNRVIIDEFARKRVSCTFDFRDELDVEWAGHPNWFFRWSKFSLPFLKHPTVPRTWFLNELTDYPDDLENFVLKPLFSFAGSGVKVQITKDDLLAVPATESGDYILQEKINYAPVVETPTGPTKVEVRLMFLWPGDADQPVAATTLTRLSKGLMLGVDFNKDMTWVGSSCAFFEE
jgi:hypothetical protein